MGTETILRRFWRIVAYHQVKLNNPQMGTETFIVLSRLIPLVSPPC